MKYLFAVSALCGLLVLQVLAQQAPTLPDPPGPPEAYPGQLTHQPPPDGFTCERQNIELSVPPERACTCERMYSPTDPTTVLEDHHCTVYCHAYACKCGIGGKPMTPAPQ